jgi:hypothetical protein
VQLYKLGENRWKKRLSIVLYIYMYIYIYIYIYHYASVAITVKAFYPFICWKIDIKFLMWNIKFLQNIW